MREAILKDINATGKKAGFKSIEVLQCVVLSDEEWTPQNEMLTAGTSQTPDLSLSSSAESMKFLRPTAQKINRKVIVKKYKSEIDVSSLPTSSIDPLTELTRSPFDQAVYP